MLGSWGMLSDVAQVRFPCLAWEEAGHHPTWHEPGWLYQQHRPPSASCDSVSFAQFCLLSHRSRAMCPTLLSLLSLGESRKTRLERVMVEIGGSLHHWPGSLHEGAKSMGSIRTSHLWHAYPSRILCESEDLGSCGWALPSLISLLSRAVGADADDSGGWGETPVSTVRAVCPVDPRSSYWPWYSSSLSPEVSPGLDLDLKGQCEVWELEVGLLSAISLMRGEQETAAHRPSPTSWLLASPTGP